MEALQLLKFSLNKAILWTLQQVQAGMMSWLRLRLLIMHMNLRTFDFLCHCFEYTDIVEFVQNFLK